MTEPETPAPEPDTSPEMPYLEKGLSDESPFRARFDQDEPGEEVRFMDPPVVASGGWCSPLEQAYPLILTDNRHLCHVQKQAAVHHGWNRQQLLLQSHRVSNRPKVAIEDIVPIIGNPRLAVCATPQRDACAQAFQSPYGRGMAKRYDLDW